VFCKVLYIEFTNVVVGRVKQTAEQSVGHSCSIVSRPCVLPTEQGRGFGHIASVTAAFTYKGIKHLVSELLYFI
jgi:hypothetical protein